ncbi:MAG: hypothetical protein ACTSPI_01255 [Candidatus Heimdallarchaeaceae archaeon]
MKSPTMSIDLIGLKKLGKGALIAGGAVVLTYLAENIGSIDFGSYTALVVGIVSILINFLRKMLVSYN